MALQHKGGEGLVFAFKDKTGEARTDEELALFIADLKKVAAHHDFGLDRYGTETIMRRSYGFEIAHTIFDRARFSLLDEKPEPEPDDPPAEAATSEDR